MLAAAKRCGHAYRWRQRQSKEARYCCRVVVGGPRTPSSINELRLAGPSTFKAISSAASTSGPFLIALLPALPTWGVVNIVHMHRTATPARRGLTFATSTSRSQPCTRSLQMARNKLIIQVQHRNSESSAINPGGNSNNGGQGRNGEEEKLTISGRLDTLLRQATLTRVPVAGSVAQCFITIAPNGWKTNRPPLRGSRKLLVCFRGLTRGL